MNRRRTCYSLMLLLLVVTRAAADEPAAEKANKPAPTQAELEKQFAETLSGAALVGHFTMTGQENKALTEERYVLPKVSKLDGDMWLFQTRIQYGNHDVALPLPLTVRWAGDTPVITLTDLAIPGMGTFTARVVIFRGQYAGTWSGGDHGGHLFGKVVRATPEELKAAEKSTSNKPYKQ